MTTTQREIAELAIKLDATAKHIRACVEYRNLGCDADYIEQAATLLTRQAEDARDARDAARYRWLKSVSGDRVDFWTCLLPEQQDEWIDKRIAKEPSP